MKRFIVFAVLVALPTALATWVFAKGAEVQCEPCDPALLCKTSGEAAKTHSPAPTPTHAAKPAPAPERAAPKPQGEDAALLALLAEPLEGFELRGEIERYDRDNLFDYINGGAPLYLDRNFRKLAASEVVVETGGELTCDVYDMNTEKDAAAIFTSEGTPSAKAVQVGTAGRAGTMSLVFHQGRYYVKLTAFDAKAEAALPKLAETIAGRIE